MVRAVISWSRDRSDSCSMVRTLAASNRAPLARDRVGGGCHVRARQCLDHAGRADDLEHVQPRAGQRGELHERHAVTVVDLDFDGEGAPQQIESHGRPVPLVPRPTKDRRVGELEEGGDLTVVVDTGGKGAGPGDACRSDGKALAGEAAVAQRDQALDRPTVLRR